MDYLSKMTAGFLVVLLSFLPATVYATEFHIEPHVEFGSTKKAEEAKKPKAIEISPWKLVDTVVGSSEESFIGKVKGMSNTFVTGSNGSKLGAAHHLMAIIFVMILGFGALNRLMGSSLEDVVSDMIRGIILFAIPFAAISNWSEINKIFYDGLIKLAGALGPLNPLEIAANLMREVTGGGSFFNKIKFDIENVWQSIIMAAVWIVGVVVVGIASIYLLFNLFAAFYLPQVFMAVGMVVGPLLVVWMPFRPLAGMAAQWVNFMIANAATLLVASIIIKAAGGTIKNLLNQASRIIFNGEFGDITVTPIVTFFSLAFLLFLVGAMLGAANNIAQGLTGGAAVGSQLLERLGGAAAGKGLNMTGATGTSGVGAAVGLAGKIASSGLGKVGGFIGKVSQNAAANAGAFVAGKMGNKAGTAVMNTIAWAGGKVSAGMNAASVGAANLGGSTKGALNGLLGIHGRPPGKG